MDSPRPEPVSGESLLFVRTVFATPFAVHIYAGDQRGASRIPLPESGVKPPHSTMMQAQPRNRAARKRRQVDALLQRSTVNLGCGDCSAHPAAAQSPATTVHIPLGAVRVPLPTVSVVFRVET